MSSRGFVEVSLATIPENLAPKSLNFFHAEISTAHKTKFNKPCPEVI